MHKRIELILAEKLEYFGFYNVSGTSWILVFRLNVD